MAKAQLKLDDDTARDLEAMRNEQPIEEKPAPEPEKPEEPKVEPVKEEPKPEVKPEVEKTVPLAALQEERRKNREEIEKANRRLALLEGLMAPKPEAAKPTEIPDPEKDAMGALKITTDQIKMLVKENQEAKDRQQQEVARQAILGEAAKLENEFIATTPDYNEASQFLINSRRQELMATGSYNPNDIVQIIGAETVALAQQALRTGRNPAELAYAIAKARGYAKAEAPKPAAESESDKIARIAAGQAASKSLGAAGGASQPTGAQMDAKTLVNMSDEEFEKYYNKLSRAEKKAIMGN